MPNEESERMYYVVSIHSIKRGDSDSEAKTVFEQIETLICRSGRRVCL